MKELQELIESGKRYDDTAVALLKTAFSIRQDMIADYEDIQDVPPLDCICDMHLECVMEEVQDILEDIMNLLQKKADKASQQLLTVNDKLSVIQAAITVD